MLPQRGDAEFLQQHFDGRSENDWRRPGRNQRQSVRAVGSGSQARDSAIHSGVANQVDEHQQVSIQDGIARVFSPIQHSALANFAISRGNGGSVTLTNHSFQQLGCGTHLAVIENVTIRYTHASGIWIWKRGPRGPAFCSVPQAAGTPVVNRA